MKPILQYDLQGNFVREWECAIYAEQELKLSHSYIWKCLHKLIKKPNPFIWKYKKEVVNDK